MRESRQTEILLESGTNELEIMEFTIGGELFGINVAKVREIMRVAPIKPIQRSHPNIEGVFKPRDKVLTVINLGGYLGLPAQDSAERDIFMITNFNNQDFAFHVHSVVGIDRISWEQIKKPDAVVFGGREGIATAIAEYDGRLITVLDFEAIVADISPATGIQVSDVAHLSDRARRTKPVLIAEDSMMLSKMIIECLHSAGYTNTIKTSDGEEAWTFLSEVKETGETVTDHVSCIISDIEMPRMDGHRLTKLVKTDPVLRNIPLVLFSSPISKEMRIKGEQLGADEQVSKPEIARLVGVVDQLTER